LRKLNGGGPGMSRTIAVVNQKGGVGKTTITLGLASAAWARGDRLLVVDLDAQANSTWVLGIEPSLEHLGAGDALTSSESGAAADMIVPGGWGDQIWVLPGAGDLTQRDTDPNTVASRRRLSRALEGVVERFDVVLIDCAPSLGLNTTNGLVAAEGALIVVEPSVFGLRGIEPVLDLIEDVWAVDNPELDLTGIVLNRVPAVSASAQARINDLKRMVGARSVWKPHIPQRVLINQAHQERAPIHSYGGTGRELATAFDALYRKLLRTTSQKVHKTA